MEDKKDNKPNFIIMMIEENTIIRNLLLLKPLMKIKKDYICQNLVILLVIMILKDIIR